MFSWKITLIQLKENGKIFKVTRSIPDLFVSETKMFKTIEEAKAQISEWLN